MMSLTWLGGLLVLTLASQQTSLAHGKHTPLWLNCSCLHMNKRNASNWGGLAVNASQALGAKNNCLMVFIGGQADELVAFQLQQLQLRNGNRNCMADKLCAMQSRKCELQLENMNEGQTEYPSMMPHVGGPWSGQQKYFGYK